MFERNELALKLACGAVVALVLYRLGLAIVHINPLYHVTIPALPTLAVDSTNAPAKAGTNSTAVATKTTTNGLASVAASAGTNGPRASTNLVARSTNVVSGARSNLTQDTNTSIRSTNEVVVSTNSTTHLTNSVAQSTNFGPSLADRKSSSTGRTGEMGPMGMPPGMPPRGMAGMPPGAFPGMPPGGFPGMAKPGPPLPPEVQARIDRVIESEILAPIMRPMPMALLGIAGKDVFLRAPNGQTGLIKEGEELGGVKLVRIGVNRVLVEQQGEQKELTIFAGLGSESLVSTKKESPK